MAAVAHPQRPPNKLSAQGLIGWLHSSSEVCCPGRRLPVPEAAQRSWDCSLFLRGRRYRLQSAAQHQSASGHGNDRLASGVLEADSCEEQQEKQESARSDLGGRLPSNVQSDQRDVERPTGAGRLYVFRSQVSGWLDSVGSARKRLPADAAQV